MQALYSSRLAPAKAFTGEARTGNGRLAVVGGSRTTERRRLHPLQAPGLAHADASRRWCGRSRCAAAGARRSGPPRLLDPHETTHRRPAPPQTQEQQQEGPSSRRGLLAGCVQGRGWGAAAAACGRPACPAADRHAHPQPALHCRSTFRVHQLVAASSWPPSRTPPALQPAGRRGRTRRQRAGGAGG